MKANLICAVLAVTLVAPGEQKQFSTIIQCENVLRDRWNHQLRQSVLQSKCEDGANTFYGTQLAREEALLGIIVPPIKQDEKPAAAPEFYPSQYQDVLPDGMGAI